jgi:hypothetical protein
MLTIMWNSSACYIIDRLSNDAKMNRIYFVTNLVILLEQAIFPRGRAAHQKNLWFILIIAPFTQIGSERISSNNMACNACQTHPLNSSNLALNDLYLFLPGKEKLEGIQLADEEQFLE